MACAERGTRLRKFRRKCTPTVTTRSRRGDWLGRGQAAAAVASAVARRGGAPPAQRPSPTRAAAGRFALTVACANSEPGQPRARPGSGPGPPAPGRALHGFRDRVDPRAGPALLAVRGQMICGPPEIVPPRTQLAWMAERLRDHDPQAVDAWRRRPRTAWRIRNVRRSTGGRCTQTSRWNASASRRGAHGWGVCPRAGGSGWWAPGGWSRRTHGRPHLGRPAASCPWPSGSTGRTAEAGNYTT